MRITRSLLVTLLSVSILGTLYAEDRSVDGSGNNQLHTEWGAAGTQLGRMAGTDYSDGVSSLAGAGAPESARNQ